MKNSDIALVILVAAISMVASYFIGNAILGDPNERVESISYMEVIDDVIESPDIETFNPTAINPTLEVYVGNCGVLEQWSPDKMICEPIDGAVPTEDDVTPTDETTPVDGGETEDETDNSEVE